MSTENKTTNPAKVSDASPDTQPPSESENNSVSFNSAWKKFWKRHQEICDQGGYDIDSPEYKELFDIVGEYYNSVNLRNHVKDDFEDTDGKPIMFDLIMLDHADKTIKALKEENEKLKLENSLLRNPCTDKITPYRNTIVYDINPNKYSTKKYTTN